jgi:hypothetical protein
VIENTAHKGQEYKKLVKNGFMEVSDWMTYLFDSDGNAMYENPEGSEKFSNQAFDECMAKRFTDDNYAYVSNGRGQANMLYNGITIEEILKITGLANVYIWNPRTRYVVLRCGYDDLTPLTFVIKWNSVIVDWNDQGKWPPMIRTLKGE